MESIPVSMVIDSLAQAMHRARSRVNERSWVAASNELTCAATLLALIGRYRKAEGRLLAEEVDSYKELSDEWDDLDTLTIEGEKMQKRLNAVK